VRRVEIDQADDIPCQQLLMERQQGLLEELGQFEKAVGEWTEVSAAPAPSVEIDSADVGGSGLERVAAQVSEQGSRKILYQKAKGTLHPFLSPMTNPES
jgi:hypothetical protein